LQWTQSVPPSLWLGLVLQTYDGASDEEAKQRADYDLRWKVALGVELDVRPFAKSTLQEFRAQLLVHEEQAAIFGEPGRQTAGEFAGEAEAGGAGQQHPGAGAEDYNLLAEGIRAEPGGGEGPEAAVGGWLGHARPVCRGGVKGAAGELGGGGFREACSQG
jgi:hypothetical protein